MKRLLLALALTPFLAAAALAGGPLVVVESTAPEIKPGAVLEDGLLTLAEGQTVVLIDQGGQIHNIDGPHKGAIATASAKGDEKLVATLSNLVGGGTDISQVGAFRSAGGLRPAAKPSESGGAGVISAWRAGDHCYDPGKPLTLRRESGSGSESANLSRLGATTGAVSWKMKAIDAPWPAMVKAEDGAIYLMRRPGRTIATKIVLKAIPESLDKPLDRIAWMAENKCAEQARAALKAHLKSRP